MSKASQKKTEAPPVVPVVRGAEAGAGPPTTPGPEALEAGGTLAPLGELPEWLPLAARDYLAHTGAGRSIREIAREEGVHASTVLRRVRRLEASRDDPLVDSLLCHLTGGQPPARRGEADEAGEPLRVLRRLAEPGALLIVAPDLPRAMVMRAGLRMTTCARSLGEEFALKGWISVRQQGRICAYELTPAGRVALRRLRAPEAAAQGLSEAQAVFAESQRDNPRRQRYGAPESPVMALSRRRERDGSCFLTPALVACAERLREDFEIAALGGAPVDWQALAEGHLALPPQPATMAGRARARVARVVTDLGPGLADVVIRTCCHLEGLELAERRLGWAARSGKIVLRIALTRLKRHYDESDDPGLIG